jgi:hypothetical protein
MNNPLDPTLRPLNDCRCCAGTTIETPVTMENRPGLDAVAFRAGHQPQFKATILAALTAAGNPALRSLKTREDDDFTMALLDGWATVADVLSFYSERIANETFLRTATERRSVLELARSIGYELNPGVAASTWLAFTVEDAPGTPGWSDLPRGTKVQSLPGPNEKPQVFETIQPLLARQEWNVLRPLAGRTPVPAHGMKLLRLRGTGTGFKPGDALLVVGRERETDSGNENWDFRRVTKVEPFPDADPEKAWTAVTMDRPLGSAQPWVDPAKDRARVFALRLRAGFFGQSAPDWRSMPDSIKAAFDAPRMGQAFIPERVEWPGFTLAEVSDSPMGTHEGTGLYGEYFGTIDLHDRKFSRTDPQIDFRNWGHVAPGTGLGTTNFSVRWTGWIQAKATGDHTFTTRSDGGVRLWINGQLIIDKWTRHGETLNSATLPLQRGMKYDAKLEYVEGPDVSSLQLLWAHPGQADQLIPTSQLYPRDIHTVHLDALHPAIVPGSWLVVSTADYQELYKVEAAVEDARANFNLTAKTTRLTLRGENLREQFNDRIREAAVFAQSEELPWATQPVYDAMFGSEIVLDSPMPGLPADRELFVSGRPARVRVTTQGAPLKLTLPDGTQRPLNVDEQLTVQEPPALQPDMPGTFRWQLRRDDGAAGLVFATTAQLAFVPAAAAGERLFESVRLKRSPQADDPGRLLLVEPLKYAYDPTTVTIYGNVVFATHGDTVGSPTPEVLGSGDANQPHQSFVLKQKPMTFTPAANPSGGETSLEIRVNDVKWREVSTLFDRGPRERVYVTRLADDGTVTVLFGDGQSGARLPTGRENVRAVYRKGLGHAGLLKAEQLTLLMTRPLGVKSVLNPKATERAVDPQALADARRNALTTVLTLDRVVSLQDYEDFARHFTGIAKALATWTWNVHLRGVFLTVAGPDGATVAPGSGLRDDLLKSLRKLGNPLVPIRVESYSKVSFRLAGKVWVQPDRVPDQVAAAVKDALRAAFGFDARSFGQPVTLSETLAVIQNVPGVAFVDLDALHLGTTSRLDHYLPAHKPDDGAAAKTVAPAQLLTLDETSLAGLEVKSA